METHNTREVEEYVPWHEDLQVLMEEYWEVWQSTENDIYQNIKSVTKRREQFDKLKAFITYLTESHLHHQLQKARQDWLREEIVKLEGMKKPLIGIHITLPADHEDLPEEILMRATPHIYNEALQTIIDRYHSELDQDKK